MYYEFTVLREAYRPDPGEGGKKKGSVPPGLRGLQSGSRGGEEKRKKRERGGEERRGHRPDTAGHRGGGALYLGKLPPMRPRKPEVSSIKAEMRKILRRQAP